MDDESIERCFNQHDTDGSGCVNKSEIEKLLTKLGLPEERQAVICQVRKYNIFKKVSH